MKIKNIINFIKDTALKFPDVHQFIEGDVYQLNTLQDINYSVVCVTQQQHQILVDEEKINYHFNIFYIDRMTHDQSNKLDVQGSAIDVLTTICTKLEEIGIVQDYTVQPFTQMFNDECAGEYLDVILQMDLTSCMTAFDEETTTNGIEL